MVFHKYQLIFTGIPKNASTSIFMMLRNPTDNHHHHQSLVSDYNTNDSELMDFYQNITIVRNPYDRFISACYQIRRDDYGQNGNKNLNEIIEQEFIEKPAVEGYINEVFIPQHKFICFGKTILADTILRYESLEQDWKKFAEEYNKTAKFLLPSKLLKFNNSPERGSYKEELKDLSYENLQLINKKYDLDFELFGYEIQNKF